MLKGFLEAVLPASAPHYAAVFMDRAGTPSQRCVSSIEELVYITGLYGNKGYDTYFGLAGFTKPWHPDPRGRVNAIDGTPKQVFRTQENAHSLKAFWLDVDIARHEADYSTVAEFFADLQRLCSTVGLPLPTMVCSGAGFHLYWVLDRPIYAKQWAKIAVIFDAVVRHIGFKADPARTRDLASAPRVVGTFNWKYPEPKAVTLVSKAIIPIAVETFASRVISYAKANNVSVKPPASPVSAVPIPVPEGLAASPQFAAAMGHIATPMASVIDKDPILVIRECRQVREAGKESEPVWFSMLTVMRHCEAGKDAARALSRIDPRFTEEEFSYKFSYVESLTGGPATCERFNRECPNKCSTCPHWNKITSPAELGRKTLLPTVSDVRTPDGTTASIGSTAIHRFEYPGKDFKQIPGKGLFALITEDKGGDTSTSEHFISSKCIYILHAQVHEVSFVETTVVYICEVIDKDGKSRQVRFSARDLRSSYAFREWMVNTQTLVTAGNEKHFGAFMQAYLARLQSKVPQIGIKSHLGWVTTTTADNEKQRGFILGNQLLNENNPAAVVGLAPGVQKYVDEALLQAGTLEGWKQIPEFYAKHNVLWGQLGMCAAFGAVFMNFAPGGAKNGVFNFWSADSGTGKTSLQRAINGVWGHQHTQLIDMVTTVNARYLIMGWRHHLPICINEVTLMSESELSEALFQISEGKEKNRMDGTKLQTSGTWDTITIMTANNPALDKLMNFSFGRDAEVKRVLDIEVSKSPGVGRDESLSFDRALESNYGHAGKIFIQGLIDRPRLLENIPKLLDAWITKHTKSQDERFWISTAAATILGGRIAKAFGLLSYDMDKVEELMLQCIAQMRTSFVAAKVSDTALVSDFLADNLRNTLVVLAENRATPANSAQSPEVDPYVRHMPSGQLDVRVELDTKTVYVRAAAFTEWCARRNITARSVLRGLAVDGVYVGGAKGGMQKPTSLRIGRGVPVLEHTVARCHKFVLKSQDSSKIETLYEDKTEVQI